MNTRGKFNIQNFFPNTERTVILKKTEKSAGNLHRNRLQMWDLWKDVKDTFWGVALHGSLLIIVEGMKCFLSRICFFLSQFVSLHSPFFNSDNPRVQRGGKSL